MNNLRSMKSSELVALYNTAAEKLGMRTVNKFSDKETAISRTKAIMQKVGTEVTVEEVRRVSSFPPPPSVEEPVCTPEPYGTPDATPAFNEAKPVSLPPPAPTGKRLAKVASRPRRSSELTRQDKIRLAELVGTPGPLDNLPKENRMSFSFKPLSTAHAPKGSANSLRSLCYAKMIKGCKFADVLAIVQQFDAGRGKGNANTIDRRAYELVRLMHYALGFGISHSEDGTIKLYTKS